MTATGTTNGNANPTVQEPKKFLLDPYREWATGEGIPIHLDFGHDLIALETGPWERYGARGCFAQPTAPATSWPIM